MPIRPLGIRPLLKLAAAAGAIYAVALGVTGCAMAPPSPAVARLDHLTSVENLPGKPGCFWKSNFQGDWTVLNESTLIVHAPLPKDAYVIKLFQPVFNLSFKQGLGFEDQEHTGQICNNANDDLLVPGWQPPQVPIIAVHALTKAQEDELLEAAGKRKPVRHPPATAGVLAPSGVAPPGVAANRLSFLDENLLHRRRSERDRAQAYS